MNVSENGSGREGNPHAGGAGAGPTIGPTSRWIRSPTGLAVTLLWLVLMSTAVALLSRRPALVLLEIAAAAFGLYATSVAFRKDRTAGIVILIALAFTFALLNWALYMATYWPRPLAR